QREESIPGLVRYRRRAEIASLSEVHAVVIAATGGNQFPRIRNRAQFGMLFTGVFGVVRFEPQKAGRDEALQDSLDVPGGVWMGEGRDGAMVGEHANGILRLEWVPRDEAGATWFQETVERIVDGIDCADRHQRAGDVRPTNAALVGLGEDGISIDGIAKL